MNAPQLAEDTVQVTLLAVSGPAGLAAQTLSQFFGLSRDRAEAVLNHGRGLISPRMPSAQAKATLPLLAALGLQVIMTPTGAAPEVERHDLSIRLVDDSRAAKLIKTLQRLMALDDLTARSFDGPAGMVLTGLTAAKSEWLANALRGIQGVLVSVSAQRTALYDLFSTATLKTDARIAIKRHLALLGSGGTSFGDALATGLDGRALHHLLAHFPRLGLFGLNQDFQRHDVLITGQGRLSQVELADFLATRAVAADRAALPSAAAPFRVETWLTRAAAQQFLGDYACIGIPATARLIRA